MLFATSQTMVALVAWLVTLPPLPSNPKKLHISSLASIPLRVSPWLPGQSCPKSLILKNTVSPALPAGQAVGQVYLKKPRLSSTMLQLYAIKT